MYVLIVAVLQPTMGLKKYHSSSRCLPMYHQSIDSQVRATSSFPADIAKSLLLYLSSSLCQVNTHTQKHYDYHCIVTIYQTATTSLASVDAPSPLPHEHDVFFAYRQVDDYPTFYAPSSNLYVQWRRRRR